MIKKTNYGGNKMVDKLTIINEAPEPVEYINYDE